MLKTLLDSLTTEQRAKLHEKGILQQRISDWKAGRRLPTEDQVIWLADVCQIDRHKLQDEIALMKAPADQKEALARLLGKLARGVVATLIFGVTVAVGGAALGLNGGGSGRLFWRLQKATMYRG